MNCPTTETLERLALGFLDDPAPARSHAGSCDACKRRLEGLVREHAALAQAAKAVPLPVLKKPARKLTFARRPERPGWMLWTGAAACLLFAGLVSMLFWPDREAERVVAQARERFADVGGRRAKSVEPPPASAVPPARPARVIAGSPAPEAAGPAMEKPELKYTGDLVRLRKELDSLSAEERLLKRHAPAPTEPNPQPAPLKVAELVYTATGTKRDPAAPPAAPAGPPPPPPREGPDTMIFKDPGINPEVDTAKETQSTFALDVDTASYTVMRNYLLRGTLPPRESVRVEEFLNYFRYQDPRPPEGTFAVRLEAAPSPFDASRHLLRVAIQAKEVRERNRKDANLVFVIDVSGSMARENRLGLVKQSLRRLVERLRPAEEIGIVVYGSTGRKLLDPTPVSRKDEILGVIDDLRTEGSTNLEQGLTIGYDLAARHFDPKRTNRVVLCTDGVANNGVTDPDALLKAVAEHAKKGVWLSVLGFGMGNLNDALMERLANRGNGNYAYIDDLAEATKIFTEKLAGMMEVVAADAKVQVEFDPATVASFRLLGYENRHVANKDFRNDAVDAGEVGAGHHVTALYEIALKPGGEGRLATVRMRYCEPGTKEMIETHDALGRAQVLDAAAKASASYRLAAAVAQFAEVLRESPRAKDVTCRKILDLARPAVADLDRPDDGVEFLRLVEKAAALGK